MRSPLLPGLCIAVVSGLVASAAFAGGRAKPVDAWVETVELAETIAQSPQATSAELRELDRRMDALHDEQHRLLDAALWLDGEEAWLVDAAAAIEGKRRAYEAACAELQEEQEVYSCEDLARAINEKSDAYDKRRVPFTYREERYAKAFGAWVAELDAMRGWMRPILVRRELSSAERAMVERERGRMHAEVTAVREALRRLEQSHGATEADRADWDQRCREAALRASDRLKDLRADPAIELARAAFASCSERLAKEVRARIDERAAVAGGSAADKAGRVKALDAQIERLITSRADVDSAATALPRAVAALGQGVAALAPGFAGDPEPVLLGMRDVVGDALGDPLVQRALRVSEAPATVFTYTRLLADSADDAVTEVLSILRLRNASKGSEEYRDDVARLGEQLTRKVARIQIADRLLEEQ